MMTELAVISACLLLGAWLNSALKALRELSWGSIHKLDSQKKKDLVEKAEGWMLHRVEYHTLTRLLALLNLAFMAVSLSRVAARRWPDLADHRGYLALITLAGAALFVLITEAIGSWLVTYNWLVLEVSMPILRVLKIVPGLILYPSLVTQRKLEELRGEDEEEKPTTEDEIEALLDHDDYSREDDDANGIEKSTGRMIRGILDLDETLVKEIMTPRVDINAVPANGDVGRVKQTIVECGHSRIPVYGKSIDDIVGVVYSKDLLDDARTRESALETIMHRPLFIPETKNVDALLQEFKQTKIHIAVVIDEYGGTAGLVTLEDILEEIVGEIADEFDEDDEEEQPLRLADDGTLTLDARTPIDDVNEVMDLDLPEEEDNVTIGGYVTGQLGRIPKVGEEVVLETVELTVEILEADDRKVDRLLLRKLDSTIANIED